MTAAHFERVDMSNRLQAAAANVAARCKTNPVQFFGLDDAIFGQFIAGLLSQIIGQCFGRDNPRRVQRIVRHRSSTPKRRAKLVNQCEEHIDEKYAREHDGDLPDEVAEDIANAMIDECLEKPNDEVASVCAVVSDAEFGE